jgi:hypothetical protein
MICTSWILVELERSCSNLSQQVITLIRRFDSKTNVWYNIEQTENTVSVINKRTFSKTRRTSYRDTSRTSFFDERRIKTHREHSIIEERTSLASVTERSLERDQRFISYNIFDRRSMSLSRAHDDMKRNFLICMKKFKNDDLTIWIVNLMLSKSMIYTSRKTTWWILVELEKSCSNLSH